MKNYYKFCLVFLALGIFNSCGKKDTFQLDGSVSGLGDRTELYLVKVLGNDVSVLDSVCLNKDGAFSFSTQADSTPGFYQLRLGNEAINFTAKIGSHIRVKIDDFPGKYSFVESSGKENEDISKIAELKNQTDQALDRLYDAFLKKQLDENQYQDSITTVIEGFKSILRNDYIFQDPKSPASYFALFQQKDGLLYFNVYDSDDAKAFAAVATAFDVYYPSSPYTKGVKDLSLLGLAAIRRDRNVKNISSEKEVVIPEISLIDEKGEIHSISQVIENNSKVLVTFTSYQAEWSPKLVKDERAIYQRYKDSGFEIYEISVDKDLYFWQNAVRTLPWITVNDRDGRATMLFNVTTIPSFYVVQNGEVKHLHELVAL